MTNGGRLFQNMSLANRTQNKINNTRSSKSGNTMDDSTQKDPVAKKICFSTEIKLLE